jgi:TetR/AcrR family transcriptional regulator, mexJK operon transcriptional repressor
VKISRSGTQSSAKREAILDAAQAVFLEMGYAAASMDAMAARAVVSKATIYAHFKAKDQLFAEVIRRRCERDPMFALRGGTEGDAREVLSVVARHLMRLFLSPETMRMYRVVVAEAVRQPELANAFYEAGPVRGKEAVAEIFRELARRGDLDIPEPWRAADLFVGMLRAEYFHRELLGLPHMEGHTLDGTIEAAVETMLRAYGRKS